MTFKELPRHVQWHQVFMNIAVEIAKMSTCSSDHVGCVLTHRNRIIGVGFNGVPSGRNHCVDTPKTIPHKEWAAQNEIHSELNAVIDAGKRGTLTPGFTAYCTLYPCIDCAKALVAAGVSRIYVQDKWENHEKDMATTTTFCKLSKVEICMLEDITGV